VPLCVPELAGNEWQYIKECLDTNWVSSVGSFVDRFEGMVAEFSNTKYAVATNSGTAALHVALLVAGIQPDDEVLVSDLSFVAPANAIRYVGAWPVFMDAEPRYWQMDPQKVQDFLTQQCRWDGSNLINHATGRPVKALLPVHILGHPCDMDPLLEVARRFDLAVIEDATESLGATYRQKSLGSLGHIACFSFNGNKLITTGGGGMIVTDDAEWAQRAKYLTTQAKDDPIEYLHNEIGYNYRLTNIQAAMGVAQMEQVEDFIAKKRSIARAYEEALGPLEVLTLMPRQPDTDPVYWLYTILLPAGTTLAERQITVQELNQAGFGSRPLWHPLHRLPPYLGCPAYQIEHSEDLYLRGISLPCSVGLTATELERSISAVKERVEASYLGVASE
jgi:perosamine synthetase